MTANPESTSVAPLLNFHPLFSVKQVPSSTVFEASDGVHFYYDWDLLCYFSSFFKDLKAVGNVAPTITISEESPDATEIISLPTATSFALAYTFNAINDLIRGLAPPSIDAKSYKARYDEIITVADSLDLPIVFSALLRTAKLDNRPPFVIMTLAILAKDSREIKALSLPLLTHPVNTMDAWSHKTLKMKSPITLIDLYDLYLRWHDALTTIEGAGKNSGDFALTCQRGCSVFVKYCGWFVKYCGSFDQLVKAQLKIVKATSADNPSLILQDFYNPKLNCIECNIRVTQAVTPTLRRVISPHHYILTL